MNEANKAGIVLLRRAVIQATITVLVMRSAYGPAHARDCEPLIADLHRLCIETEDVWIVADRRLMERLREGIRYSNAHWDWLRDIYRKAAEGLPAGT